MEAQHSIPSKSSRRVTGKLYLYFYRLKKWEKPCYEMLRILKIIVKLEN